jgi:N-methylhydantoinase A
VEPGERAARLDVRDFTLTTFGGSGALLACRLADVLDLRTAVVPRDPGNLSAYGLLTVDVRNDYVRTAVRRDAELDLESMAAAFAELQRQAAGALDGEGFPPSEHRFARSADLRYFGQAFEVRVSLPVGAVDRSLTDAGVDRFHTAHQQLYGYAFRDDPRQQVEWVNLRVTGIGPIHRPPAEQLARGDGDPARARRGSRQVRFDHWIETPVYDRAALLAGDVVVGPAVIEEYGATVPLHPGFAARVDSYGNLVVTR